MKSRITFTCILAILLLLFIQINLAEAQDYALQFDGDDQVMIPDDESLNFSGDGNHTIELWFKYTGNRSVYHILGKRGGCGHSALNYQIARDGNALLHTNSCYDVVSAGINPPHSEWIHMAVTYDGGILRLYLNGTLEVTTPFTYGCKTTDPLRFGTSGTCSVYQRFIGFIDEVRIWNITRTEQEIANSYNKTINPNTPGLVGYWNFNEELDDQNAYDSSSLNNNGTLGSTLSVDTDDPTRVLSDAPLLALDHDASVVEILAPSDVVEFETTIAPQAVIENLGLQSETIPVNFQIGFDYSESTTIALSPGESGVVTFPDWFADDLGSIPIQVSTSLFDDRATFNDKVLKIIAVSASTTAPVITKISPESGGNAGSVTVTVEGNNFQEDLEAKLVRTGEADILASSNNIINHTKITAVFDLTDATPGSWDLVIINPDREVGVFPNGFDIEVGGSVRLQFDILGRTIIRSERGYDFTLFFVNTGNIDAQFIPVWIRGIPKTTNLTLSADENVIAFPNILPFSIGNPLVYETDEEKVILLLINKIPPNTTNSFNFNLLVSDTLPSINLDMGFFEPVKKGTQIIYDFDPESNLDYFHPLDRQALEEALRIGKSGASEDIFWTNWGVLGHCMDAACNLADEIRKATANPESKLYKWKVHTIWGCAEWPWELGGHAAVRLISFSTGKSYYLDNFINPAIDLCEMEDKGDGKFRPKNCHRWSMCDDWHYDEAVAEYCRQAKESDNTCSVPQKLPESHEINIVGSIDPNDKVGFQGSGNSHFVTGENPSAYAVYFENIDTATAPAQEVVITDQLDIETLDLSTFSLGPITFGDNKIEPQSGLYEYVTEVDLWPDNNLMVKIEAKLDIFSGLITWRFSSIDPDTGELPEDPLAGFLPPNINPPEGEGHVVFTVKPKENLETGTEIKNMATIVFDVNPPIETPKWFNTIDNTKPTSQVLPLASIQPSADFDIYWSGSDEGAGIRDYTIFISEDGGSYAEWLTNTPETGATFAGENGKTYAFYSVARDQTGNLEDAPDIPDTVITVLANQPPTANAGPDQTVAAGSDCTAFVTLDGSASSDPDGDPLTYIWTWDGGSATGVNPSIQLPLGTHTMTLIATDGTVDSEPDTVGITVKDTTPPEINLNVSPVTLWPPNHKMVPIIATILASDNCDLNPVVELKSITTNESEETNTYDPNYDDTLGEGNATDDIQVDADGTIFLRAERSGSGEGRIYTILYKVADASGNSTTAEATVTVPHN